MTDQEIRDKIVEMLQDVGLIGTVYRDHSENELIEAAIEAFKMGYFQAKQELR